MAAGILPPETGSEFSPCEGGCNHRDCAALRATAESICHHCEKPIGWDTRFYNTAPPGWPGLCPASEQVPVHALCEEIAIEEEQR